MGRCDIIEGCWFHAREMASASAGAEMLRKYCNGKYMQCARYQFVQYFGFRHLPRDLQPNDIGQVKAVLRFLID